VARRDWTRPGLVQARVRAGHDAPRAGVRAGPLKERSRYLDARRSDLSVATARG